MELLRQLLKEEIGVQESTQRHAASAKLLKVTVRSSGHRDKVSDSIQVSIVQKTDKHPTPYTGGDFCY